MSLKIISQIKPLDDDAQSSARRRQDNFNQAHGSLGRLEQLSIQIAGITGDPILINEKVVLVMAGDHGVVAEGVSAYPRAVTPQMVANFLGGGAAVDVLARPRWRSGCGCGHGCCRRTQAPYTQIWSSERPAYGTQNLALEAMSREQAVQSLEAGVRNLPGQIDRSLDLLAHPEIWELETQRHQRRLLR